MTSGNFGAHRAPAHSTPEQLAAELAELVRDLHELLESYAPTWYTEDLDTRVRKTLTRFSQPTKPLQKTKPPRDEKT
jgi:hypothetical protein